MDSMKLSTLISADQIANKVREIGRTLTDRFRGQDLIAVGVLKGSFMFYADLIREIETDIICEFCGASSYADAMHSSGEVKLTMDISRSIRDKHVLLIEDIVDTGLTLNFLRDHFLARKPKSLLTATMLLKPDALKVECPLDFVGFKIPNDFVVGYGLDYQGMYRQLPYIAQISNMN